VIGNTIVLHEEYSAPHKASLRGYGRELKPLDPQSDIEYKLQLVLGYSNLFPGKPLDAKEEIKNFSREMLVKMVLVLGKNYGACKISDMKKKPFFSYQSDLYEERMKAIYAYIVQNSTTPDRVSYACQQTFLEFLKLVFGTPIECFNSKYKDYIAEVKVFDILLALNEQKVTKFVPSKHKAKGFKNVFDKFIDSHILKNNIGVENMSPFENIDGWMLNDFENNKQSYYMSIVERLKKQL